MISTTSHPKVEYNYLNDKIIIINPNEFNTYDILKISDYVITDYSALIMDALVINKKILLYVYDYQKYKRETGLNINLLEDYPNITKTDAQDIVDIIINNKYNEKEYQKFANKYKPKVKNSISLIINLIKECLNETN